MSTQSKVVWVVLVMVVVLALGVVNLFFDIWPVPVLAAVLGFLFLLVFIRSR